MKQLIIGLSIFFVFSSVVIANDQMSVQFSKCIDGDTAKVLLKEDEITVRFLAVDTPETKHPTIGQEPYGKEASNYTCTSLINANTIVIEYDANSDKTDKYGRHLAWVFVDGALLQESLIEQGLAEIAYLYGDYKYTPLLEEKQAYAKANQFHIWSGEETRNYDWLYLIGFILGIFILLKLGALNKRKAKSYGKKVIKKYGMK